MIRKLSKDSLIKNSIYLIMASFFSVIIGFFFWIIAARYYTQNDIGMTSAIISSMSLISIISLVGFPTALIFYLPRFKDVNKIINSCIILSALISIILSLVFIAGLKIWAPDIEQIFNNLELILAFVIITTMVTISAIMSGSFTAGRRSSFHMFKENIFGIIKIFPLILFTGFGAMGIFLSWGLGLMIAITIGFILLNKLWKYSPSLKFDPIIKNMAGFSAGNYVAGIFYSLPRMIFPIMILNLISSESAGYFFIAMTVAGLLYGISQSMSNSLLAESSNGEDLWKSVRKAIRLNLLLLIPGILLFIIFGKFVLNMFNHNYGENASTVLIILALASIPLSMINMFNTVRNAQKRVMSTVKINAIVAIITIILSIPLMKTTGIEGAALAYLIANTVGAIIVIIRMKNPIEFTLKTIKGDKNVIPI